MLEGTCLCGAASWRFDGKLEGATACNCTACRRYGVLWGYGYTGKDVQVSGETRAYLRSERAPLGFHFCPDCGSMVYWLSRHPEADGSFRIGFNLRLAEPERIADVPIDHFDGLETFTDLPRDERCVRDMWF